MKFKFFEGMKTKKHAVTATCLALGAILVTSSAYASYDDAKGYSNYKEAMKSLVLYDDNYTVDGRISFSLDGKEQAVFDGRFMADGKNCSIEATAKNINGVETVYEKETTYGGKRYVMYPEENGYRVYDGAEFERMDPKDERTKKAVRFMELFADTMVGDLKNNFVLENKDGDNRNYAVELSGKQIPEIVNAGLSLMLIESDSSDNSSYVTYENYEKAFAAYYEQEKGEKWDGNWDEKADEICDDFSEHYEQILEDKGDKGIVQVKADGSYKYYATYDAYVKANPTVFDDQMINVLGDDAYISNASCYFTVDNNGKLVSNDIVVVMTGKDMDGKTHELTVKMELDCSDYGSTKVPKFDTTGLTKLD